MNIGIVLYGYPPERIGGAELQAQRFAQKLSYIKHEVTIFAGSGSNEIKNENPNLRIIKIKYKNIKILRIFLLQLIAFMPVIKRYASHLDLLLCYQVNPSGIVGLFSKWMFKIPLITWVRAETEYRTFLRKFLFTPILIKYSDKFIVQTLGIKRELMDIYSSKLILNKNSLENIRIIPNGIDMDNDSVVPYNSRNGLLYVGRLHRIKGIQFLIEAVKDIKERLFVIGEGPEKKKLMDMSKSLNIEFLGKIPPEDVGNYMKQTKVLILPSLSEALPNVILEAMSFGLPIIATKVGGIVDVVEHGKTGILVEPRNSKQIKEGLQILLKREDLWKEMSKNCLKEAEKFSWENVKEKFEHLVSEIHQQVLLF